MLAGTGAIYLLRFQIEPMLHAKVMTVQPGSTEVPYAAQLTFARQAYPALSISSLTEPGAPDRATRFSGTLPDGSTGRVRQSMDGSGAGHAEPDTTLSGAAIRLHGD